MTTFGSNGEDESPIVSAVGAGSPMIISSVPVGSTKSGGSDGATVNAGPSKSDSAGASGPGTRIGASVGCAAGRS